MALLFILFFSSNTKKYDEPLLKILFCGVSVKASAVNKFITRDRKKKEEAMVETTTPEEAVSKPWSPLD